MKKILCLVFALLTLVSLCGCGKSATLDTITTVKEDSFTNAKVILFKDERGEVLFYNSDIERVFARESDENGYYIELEMTKDGAEKLRDATRRLVGESIKMYINNIPVVSAMVVAEIKGGSFILSRHTTEEEMLLMFDELT